MDVTAASIDPASSGSLPCSAQHGELVLDVWKEGRAIVPLGTGVTNRIREVRSTLELAEQPKIDEALSSMTTTQRRTLYFLLVGLLLSIGTPAYLGLARPGMAVYLLDPVIFAAQSLPYLLAAGLWLPWRSPRASTIGQVLAGLLFLVAAVLYIPMVTGLWATGGDMVALGFFLIAIGTTLSLLLITLVAFGTLWLRRRVPRT